MWRIIIKFISLFIVDKNKRQKFKEKYDPLERLKTRIIDTREILFGVSDNLWKIYPQCKKIIKYIHQFNPYSTAEALKKGVIPSYKEHCHNLEVLKRNLDKSALKNLESILEKSEKLEYFPLFIPQLIYNEEELTQWIEHHRFKYEIEKCDDYYKYKNFKLPVNEFRSNIFLYNIGMHKLKTLDKLDNDAVLIDAGANILDSALVMRKFTENKIIAFEPVTTTYEIAHKTIILNDLKNIVIEKMGLSFKNEKAKIFINPISSGSNTQIENDFTKTLPYELCKNIRLDDYVKEHNLKVGLIKTDVEGFEMNLLKGAEKTISEQKPILIISIYHNYNDFYKIKPYIEDLGIGYKFDFFKGPDDGLGEVLLLGEVY